MKTIIGIDPDSNRHGVAIYRNGALSELLNLNTIQLYIHITQKMKTETIEIHMENPKGVSTSTFSHMRGDPMAVKFKKSEGVGRVKQAQHSIEQMAEQLGVKVVLHRNSSRWKKGADKELFKRTTKWEGRSNEETRSAAYFGMLGCS